MIEATLITLLVLNTCAACWNAYFWEKGPSYRAVCMLNLCTVIALASVRP